MLEILFLYQGEIFLTFSWYTRQHLEQNFRKFYFYLFFKNFFLWFYNVLFILYCIWLTFCLQNWITVLCKSKNCLPTESFLHSPAWFWRKNVFFLSPSLVSKQSCLSSSLPWYLDCSSAQSNPDRFLTHVYNASWAHPLFTSSLQLS